MTEHAGDPHPSAGDERFVVELDALMYRIWVTDRPDGVLYRVDSDALGRHYDWDAWMDRHLVYTVPDLRVFDVVATEGLDPARSVVVVAEEQRQIAGEYPVRWFIQRSHDVSDIRGWLAEAGVEGIECVHHHLVRTLSDFPEGPPEWMTLLDEPP